MSDGWFSVEDHGVSVGNTAQQNADALIAMLATFDGGTNQVGIYFPPKAYPCGTFYTDFGKITLLMEGTTLFGNELLFGVSSGASDVQILGGRFVNTGNSDATYLLAVSGTRCEIAGTIFEKAPVAGGYMIYIRETSRDLNMHDFTCLGSNGIFVEGIGHRFSNFLMENASITNPAIGGDDCFAFKSVNGPTESISVTNGVIRGYYAAISIGSEIGKLAAANPSRDRYVRGVIAADIELDRCTDILFIKPGAISVYDYRDGLVEDITLDNITLTDVGGARFQRGVVVTAARGAIVRRVTGRNLKINARALSLGLVPTIGGPDIRVFNLGSAATIEDIDIQLEYNDPYSGADHHATNAPGYPVQYAGFVEKENPALGTMSRLTLDLNATGSKEAGLYVGGGLDGAVEVKRARLRNMGVNPGGVTGGIYSQSHIVVKDDIEVAAAVGYPIGASALVNTLYFAEQAIVSLGTVAAGTSDSQPCFVMPKRGYIHRIMLVNTDSIAQNNTNYSTFQFINSATGNPLASATTKQTGGINILANTPTSMTTNNALTASDALDIPKGTLIRFTKADSGSGRATKNMRAVIQWVPHGR